MGIFRTSGKKAKGSPATGTSPSSRRGSSGLEDCGSESSKLKGGSKCPSSSGCSTLDSSNKCGELRYTKFTISNVPGEKHAIFVPESTQLTPAILAQVCSALGREVPSLLLRGMGSLRHPARMSSPHLRRCPALKQLMGEARRSLGMPEAGPQSGDEEMGLCSCRRPRTLGGEGELRLGAGNEREDQALVVDAADGVLEKKLAAAVSYIAKAATRANVWTLSGPRITSFELFLQQCIESGDADVFRLVIGHMQDRAYMESTLSTRLLKHLFRCSESLNHDTADKARTVNLQGDLWDRARNASNREFAEHGYDHWSFESYEDARVAGHPLTQWPWPYADLFLLFFREEAIPPATPMTVVEPDWAFRTQERLDREAIPFAPDVLAPIGHVFIGGSDLHVKKRVLQAMQATCPVVLLDNTPGLAKQMSLLVAVIKKAWDPAPMRACGPYLRDGATWRGSTPSSTELLQEMVPSKILKHVESEFDCSGMDPDERLALSDVVGLLDLARRRPQAFRETVCIVDPLQGVDRTSTQLATALAGNYVAVRGARAASACSSLAMQGWRLHRRLVCSAAKLQRNSTVVVVTVGTLLFLAAVLAVFMVSLGLEKAARDVRIRDGGEEEIAAPLSPHSVLRIDFDAADLCFLRVALLALPVTAGFLVALQSRHQTPQKWASAHTAASQVVAELYQFLGCAGPYRSGTAAGNQRRFLRRLQDVEKRLAASDVEADDLLGRGTDPQDESFPKDSEELQEHIQFYLYGRKPPTWLARRLRDLCTLSGNATPGPWSSMLLEAEPKDMNAPLTAEIYMETRITPLREHYGELIRHLSWVSKLFFGALIVCLIAGAGLSVFGLSLWIPVPLGLATLIMTLSRWFAPAETLSALSSALIALDSMDTRWKQSDVREHRTEVTKCKLIAATERLSLHVDTVWSRAVAVPDDEDEEGEGGRGEAFTKAEEVASRQWRARPISVTANMNRDLTSGTFTPLSD